MRFALIADIHGNLAALEAVVADIAREHVDRTICLGDVVATGPQPHEVIVLLRQHADAVVMGNTDAFMLDPQPTPDADEQTQRWETIDGWCAEQLSDTDLRYVRTFQPTVEAALDGDTRMLAFHGSPRSFHERILATTPDDELAAMLGSTDHALFVGGHTHVQLFRRLGGSIVLNPGSVGMAYTTAADGSIINPAWAEYAIVQATNGRLSVDLRRVPLDRAVVARTIRMSGMPYAAWLAEDWETAIA